MGEFRDFVENDEWRQIKVGDKYLLDNGNILTVTDMRNEKGGHIAVTWKEDDMMPKKDITDLPGGGKTITYKGHSWQSGGLAGLRRYLDMEKAKYIPPPKPPTLPGEEWKQGTDVDDDPNWWK